MRLGRYLSSLTMLELDSLRYALNLTDDELLVFNELAKGRSLIATADKCGVATSTVSNRTKAIVTKINRVQRG